MTYDYFQSLSQLKDMLETARLKKDIAEQGRICNRIGIALMEQGKYREAIKYHRTDLELSSMLKEDIMIAIPFRQIAKCYRALQSFEKAILHHEKDLSICRKLQNLFERQHAWCEYGNTYMNRLIVRIGLESNQYRAITR